MRHIIPKDIKNRVLAAIAVLMVIGLACLLFETWRHTNDEDIQTYVNSYVEKVGKSDIRYKEPAGQISQAKDEKDFYRALYAFDRRMFVNGDQMKAFGFLRQCLVLLRKDTDMSEEEKRFELHCYLMLGSASDETGLRSMSHSYYFEGLRKIDDYGIETLRGDFLNNLGVSMLRTGNLYEASKYFNNAITAAEKEKNGYLLSIIYTNLAGIKNIEKKYDQAIDYALKSLGCIDPQKQSDDYYSVNNAIGNLYLDKGDVNLAITYIKNAYNHHLKSGNKYYLFEACLSLAKAYRKDNNPDSTLHYLALSDRIAKESGNAAHRQHVLKMQADIYADNDMPAKALELKNEIIALKDSIYNEENATRIREADTIYNIEHESQSAETGMRSWNPVVVFTSMACLVGALLLMIVWMVMMRRKNDSLNRQKTEALSDYATLQQKLLDEEKEKNRIIKEDLDENHRKLTSFTLSHIESNQKVESVETGLKKMLLDIPQRDRTLRDSIKSMITTLTTLKADAQWEEFHYHFDSVHPGFYATLDARHPGLTPKDRRLCALISLGLSSKEIAGITFREVRSVETSRTRLRKKLGLDTDSSLFDYLVGLTHTTADAATSDNTDGINIENIPDNIENIPDIKES